LDICAVIPIAGSHVDLVRMHGWQGQ
jgi:hypothetical protein